MIDFHSHILPKMDDGSRSIEESVKMLRSSYDQGVDIIAATPHFYARHESPDEFLARREKSFDMLKSELDDKMPQVLLGAEVLLFPGMSRSEDVAKLTLEGTDLLLVELPFFDWSKSIVDELRLVENNLGVRVVLAHLERYLHMQKRSVFNELLNEDFLIQCNAEAFESFSTRRFALKLMKYERLNFLGTDCHNMRSRKPNMEQAVSVIKKKTEKGYFEYFDNMAHKIIKSR